jgi:hypothetical protein
MERCFPDVPLDNEDEDEYEDEGRCIISPSSSIMVLRWFFAGDDSARKTTIGSMHYPRSVRRRKPANK